MCVSSMLLFDFIDVDPLLMYVLYVVSFVSMFVSFYSLFLSDRVGFSLSSSLSYCLFLCSGYGFLKSH